MYYVIEVTRDKEGVESKSIESRTDYNVAVALFYQNMANDMQNPDLTYLLNMVINQFGGVEKEDHYLKPVLEEVGE